MRVSRLYVGAHLVLAPNGSASERINQNGIPEFDGRSSSFVGGRVTNLESAC